MFRLNDTLSTPNDTHLVVKLGRALKEGEFRVKLYLLMMRDTEVRSVADWGCGPLACCIIVIFSHSQFCRPLMDSIVVKGMTVLEFKQQIVKEALEQRLDCPLNVERSGGERGEGEE